MLRFCLVGTAAERNHSIRCGALRRLCSSAAPSVRRLTHEPPEDGREVRLTLESGTHGDVDERNVRVEHKRFGQLDPLAKHVLVRRKPMATLNCLAKCIRLRPAANASSGRVMFLCKCSRIYRSTRPKRHFTSPCP